MAFVKARGSLLDLCSGERMVEVCGRDMFGPLGGVLTYNVPFPATDILPGNSVPTETYSVQGLKLFRTRVLIVKSCGRQTIAASRSVLFMGIVDYQLQRSVLVCLRVNHEGHYHVILSVRVSCRIAVNTRRHISVRCGDIQRHGGHVPKLGRGESPWLYIYKVK